MKLIDNDLEMPLARDYAIKNIRKEQEQLLMNQGGRSSESFV
jgi:hypothetical protein